MKRIVVSSAKIILILSIVKRIVKSASTRTCVFVTFTPQGVQVKINASWFWVSVPLDIDTGGFMMRVSELEKLSKSEGDIVFSFGCDDAPPAYKGSADEIPASVTYIECGVTKKYYCEAGSFTDSEICDIPKDVAESSDFLQAVAMCVPYADKENAKYSIGSVYLDNKNIVATNGRRLIALNDVCVPSFDSSFLLCGEVASMLPKFGTCRLAKTGHVYLSSCKNGHFLYIGLPDYHIWTTCVEGRFPNFNSIIPTKGEDEQVCEIHIDKRDVLACCGCIGALPKNRNDFFIAFHFVDGRLCLDSCAADVPNTRLRFSEFTTCNAALDFSLDALHFRDALQLSNDLWYKPEERASVATFEFDKGWIVMLAVPVDNEQDFANIIELKDLWVADKKPIKKKPMLNSSLFMNADKDRISVLKTENEILRKENEQLRNEIAQLRNVNL